MADVHSRVPLLTRVIREYRARLTSRGQYLFWTILLAGTLGLDTRRNQVFKIFAVLAAIGLIAALFAFLPRPQVSLQCELPARATALAPVTIRASIVAPAGTWRRDFCFALPPPRGENGKIHFIPWRIFFEARPDEPVEIKAQMEAKQRGRYLLRGPEIRGSDPLRLALTRELALQEQILLVYPRFYSMENFIVPLGRRYQPGGIPLASSTGDAIEFVGTREYREGDPIKHIHWRSFARRGEPVVKEYQEEYFCRIAVILDTFVCQAEDRRSQGF